MIDIEPQGQHHGGGHETTDVGLRGILVFAAILVLVTAVLQVGLGLWAGAYSREERRTIASRPARLRDETGQFPAPRLQGNPANDMTRFRKEEDVRLEDYGWVDRRNGIARIPVARAMDHLVRKGLPIRKAEDEPARQEPAKDETAKEETP
jgi:hypothetical protein